MLYQSGSLQDGDEVQVDMDAIEEFFDDFKSAHSTCDSVLIQLEDDPNNDTLLNSLFRSIHTIKGNLVYVGLKDLTPMIQSLEDLLDAIRHKQIPYDSLLCDVILLSLDRTESMVQARIEGASLVLSDDDIDSLCINISCMADVGPEDRIEYIKACLFILDPDTHLEVQSQLDSSMAGEAEEKCDTRELRVNTDYLISNESVKDKEFDDVLEKHGVDLDEDIRFFKNLSTPLESRSFYWKGRTLRLLVLSLAMNERSGNRVDASQLAVAVMMHDLGMSFLSRSLLINTGALSENERYALQRHPGTSSLLLSEFEKWGDAALMVLQHHEQIDGSGYPNHLTGDKICDGAKIIAIADTFDARSHERAHHTLLKRPLVRTMNEINNFSGTQFDPFWVEIFNQVVGAANH
ncbi:HD domain-containing phosphohydrolase [Shewanella nanhaiensis]|uniref:HD domain-containing protein n=1 Tax=Shewanella nanhaiensis TaxID=2864872 RepID=A0ABS7EAG5_9GAMM|nr:HD domain-containing phosphohydrolase [Shewanella nanhaiensis]MBW8186328.1 HD domain-containing protein [Shewanella nanhaiensis]